MYGVPGVPDLCYCIQGRAVYIEVKDEDKPEIGSDLQERFLEKMRKAGAIGFVANNLKKVIKELTDEGILFE